MSLYYGDSKIAGSTSQIISLSLDEYNMIPLEQKKGRIFAITDDDQTISVDDSFDLDSSNPIQNNIVTESVLDLKDKNKTMSSEIEILKSKVNDIEKELDEDMVTLWEGTAGVGVVVTLADKMSNYSYIVLKYANEAASGLTHIDMKTMPTKVFKMSRALTNGVNCLVYDTTYIDVKYTDDISMTVVRGNGTCLLYGVYGMK